MKPPRKGTTRGPIVLATWDFGRALCVRAQEIFRAGGDLLDALEQGVRVVEDDPKVRSVGYGGLPNEKGIVQLDAAMMDGRTHRCGAVAALERIRNPISVARKVMERTHHVLLVGAGASVFARKMGFREQNLLTPEARAAWRKRKEGFWRLDPSEHHDTVSAVAMDAAGDLAVAVSTSGLPWKIAGRVGDSPIIGAGGYVDNDVGAAAATGVGELAISNAASFAIVERMRAGVPPAIACREILQRVVRKHPEVTAKRSTQLALIAIDVQGRHGAAALRKTRRPFRYALARGLDEPAALYDVRPMLTR